MTRIIAGRAGSLTLAVPDAGTRPTSDRVRESVFGALESAGILDGAAVVDLYAGSGALGLESISRGAASADLVEKSPRAAAVTSANARIVAKAVDGAVIRVHKSAVDSFLRASSATWDLAFLDPPYDLDDTALRGALELLRPRMSTDGLALVERATRSGRPTLPDGWQPERDRRYGDTTVWWLAAD